MKKIVLALASVALVALLSLGASGSMPREAGALTTKPNIIFILTDDMRKDDLKYMTKTKNLLQSNGMTFQNAFVSHALCCPSRATIMRGQYAHNTHVWSNSSTTSGGWQAYKDDGGETDNVATRLDAAGYRTGLFGKYLNGYMDNNTDIPKGWDRWFATQGNFFGYNVNDQGTIRHFGTNPGDYQTNVLSRETNTFISESASQGTPFFAYVAPKAPHLPATPHPDYEHAFDGIQGPRLPSFNEKDVSDKPSWIRQLSRLTDEQKKAINTRHEKRVESLQSVDDLVAGVVSTLRNAEALSNTYIFFTSDNGWHHGEHRIPFEKSRPYEESINMPLLARGPQVPEGTTTYKLTLNTDYTPTFTDLACSLSTCDTQNWSYVPDGRSLEPVLHGNASTWRNAILLEAAADRSPAYRGIRTVNTSTTTRKYVEYSGGARELYNLENDPYELVNKYKSTSPPSGLASRLEALKTCAGNGCRAAENGQ